MIGRDGIAGLACLVASLVLLGLTRGLPQPALVPIGPAFYPRVILLITAALSIALVVTDLRRVRVPAVAAGVSYRLVVLTFVVFGLYVFLLPALGYRVGTFLFIAVLQVMLEGLGRTVWWRVVLVALAGTIVTYLVFETYLSVLLPRGRLTGF